MLTVSMTGSWSQTDIRIEAGRCILAAYELGISRINMEKMDALMPNSSLQNPPIVAMQDALQVEADALKRLQAETTTELNALLPAILDKSFKGRLW